ncbi:MAG TPA: hypothetical protein VFJ43_08095, partial [Bacteroidia bacterium]|nr:hypothetical protein [Bacteroidia bacterium]
MPEEQSEFRSAWIIVLPVTILFAVLGWLGIMHHEMWLDETHHWLLAKDSGNLSELFFNARYEGHPMLWNILLFILAKFTSDPFAMQVLNLCISVFGVFLFLRHARFSLTEKILVVFSYFVFYEYTELARNYSLAFLLLVIVCILFQKRRKHFLGLSITLFVLAQTHLFAAIIAEGIFFLLIYEKFSVGKVSGEKFYKNFLPGCLILFFSLVLV